MSIDLERQVGVATAVKPKFLTLTKSPANQIAFRVVRDDNGVERMVNHVKRTRSTTRAATAGLLSIVFEAGLTKEQVEGELVAFGLEGYEIAENDGVFSVTRNDIDASAETVTLNIGGGRVVTILKPVSLNEASDAGGVKVCAVEFAADYFVERSEITEWLTRNNVDFCETAMENDSQGKVVVRRSESVVDDVRRLEVDPGVVFVVCRAETTDVPEQYVVSVSEAAYGNWGWGHLDFAASMADTLFCELAEEATYKLCRVMDTIIFSSSLPLVDRKELVATAAGQYAAYVAMLMDSLPARVVVSARRSTTDKELHMSQTNEEVKPAVVVEAVAAVEPQVAAQEPAVVTRSELDQITEGLKAVAASVASLQAEMAARSAEPVAAVVEPADESAAKPAAEADPVLEALAVVTRSLGEVSTRLEHMEATTVARSDSGDTAQTKERDVFSGMFGNKKA